MEGAACFGTDSCATEGLTLPILDYTHADGCSVTGGFVYRGSEIPALVGTYLYGDFCNGWVNGLEIDGDGAIVSDHELFAPGTVGNLTSFGRDGFGEAVCACERAEMCSRSPRPESRAAPFLL